MGTRVVQRQVRFAGKGLRGLDQGHSQGWRQKALVQGQDAVPGPARMQASTPSG